MDAININQTEVDGLLYIVLRIMRFIGAVPLRFEKCGSVHIIYLSQSCTWPGSLITTVLCTALFVGLIWDVSLEDRSQAVCATTVESSVFWTLNFCIISAASLLGIYGAPHRMREFIFAINYLKKVNLQINGEVKAKPKESSNKTLLVFNFLIAFLGICSKIFIHQHDDISYKPNVGIYYLYCSIYPLYILNYLVLIQSLLILQIVINSHQWLNETLGSITERLEKTESSPTFGCKLKINPSWKMINRATDHLANPGTGGNAEVLMTNTEKQLRQMLLHYVRLCEVKLLLNKHEGPMGLLHYLMFLINATNMIFNLISIILYTAYSQNKVVNTAHNSLWVLVFLNNLIIVHHHCHQAEAQFGRTKALVSRMCHVMSFNGPLLRNLDFLFYLLQTLNPQFSPLGIFITTRNLIFTMLNSVIGYIIVFVQFRFKTSFG